MKYLRNTAIREELQTKPVLEFIEKRQLSWWGHLVRMDDKRPVKEIWSVREAEKRRRGRPREEWNGTVEKILRKKGTTLQEARICARDKKQWAKLVHT